jgi:hypothetical protein
METLKKRDILEEVLIEHGYSGWYVIAPNMLNAANLLVINPKERKMGEISIPDEWLDDPSRRSTIGESLALTIRKCSDVLAQVHLSSSRSSRP